MPASTIRITLLILLAGDILLAVRNGLGPAAVVASLTAVLLMDLLFELSLQQFSVLTLSGPSDTIRARPASGRAICFIGQNVRFQGGFLYGTD